MNHRVAALISLALWVFVIVAGVFLYFTGSLRSYPVEVVYKEVCDAFSGICQKSPDAINLAVQLGRLDWVATALAILGAGVGLLAILSFIYAKERAEIEAQKTAKECVSKLMDELRKSAEEELEKAKNELFSDAWAEMVKHLEDKGKFINSEFDKEVGAEIGDQIAVKVEDEGND